MPTILTITTTYLPIHQTPLSGPCPRCGQCALKVQYFQLQKETEWTLRLTDKVSGLVACTACQHELAPVAWDDTIAEAYQKGELEAVRLPTFFRWKKIAKIFLGIIALGFPLAIWAVFAWADHLVAVRTAISQQPKPGDLLLAMPIATDTDPEPKSAYRWLKVEQVGETTFSLIPYAGVCTDQEKCPRPPESALQPAERFHASRDTFRKSGNNLNGKDEHGAERHYFVTQFERP